MRYTTILLIFLMAFTFGCAKMVIEGRQIDESKVKDLMASSNTADKVTQVFGKPDKVEKMGSGEEQYSYRYYYMNPHWWTTNDVQEQNLKVMVKDQAVQGYSYRKSSTEKITKE
jgi:hypothetical protein